MLAPSRIAGRIRDIDESFVRRIDRNAPALRLLNAYVRQIIADPELSFDLALQKAASEHICDLVALALGQKSEVTRAASRRGAPAAHLEMIKRDVLARLAEPGLSTADLSRTHGLSERYIRGLFQREGTSLSEFLRQARLDRALQALQDPQFATSKVSEIAYNLGFGDLSNFNHEFRRRFGATPSEMRALRPARPADFRNAKSREVS